MVNTRLKALDEIYKIYTLLHLGTPIWKPKKALLASVLRTKLTAPETKPSGRSEAARSSGKKVHNARCSDSASRGCTESKNRCLWCEACVQMVHQALCSARMNNNCKISLFFLFREARLLPFLSNMNKLQRRGTSIQKIKLHRSELKNSATFRQTFSHFRNFIFKV